MLSFRYTSVGGGQARLDKNYRLHELNFMFVHVVLE